MILDFVFCVLRRLDLRIMKVSFFVFFVTQTIYAMSEDELKMFGYWRPSSICLFVLPSKRIIAGNAWILSGSYSYYVNRSEFVRALSGVIDNEEMGGDQRKNLVQWGVFAHAQIHTGSPMIFHGKIPETIQLSMLLASRSTPMCIKDVRNPNVCIDVHVVTSRKDEVSSVAVVEKASGDTLLFCRIGMKYY